AGAEIENLQHARLPRDDVRHTDSVGIDEVRAEFAGTLGAQGRKPNKLQSEVREGYDSADSTHALRAKGGTNRSKSRCQCRRSARILVVQASCLQVARLPSLAFDILLPLLKQQRRKIRQIPPPHRPTMVAFGFEEVAANAVLLQHFDKLPAVLHQAIVLATRDPEQFEF